MPVHLAESPLTCVAVGSGRSLEEFEAIHRTRAAPASPQRPPPVRAHRAVRARSTRATCAGRGAAASSRDRHGLRGPSARRVEPLRTDAEAIAFDSRISRGDTTLSLARGRRDGRPAACGGPTRRSSSGRVRPGCADTASAARCSSACSSARASSTCRRCTADHSTRAGAAFARESGADRTARSCARCSTCERGAAGARRRRRGWSARTVARARARRAPRGIARRAPRWTTRRRPDVSTFPTGRSAERRASEESPRAARTARCGSRSRSA